MTPARRPFRIARGCAATAMVAQALFPLYWALLTSFRHGPALFSAVPFALPDASNYRALLSEPSVWRETANSALCAAMVAGISLLLAIPAAYALGRMEFRGRRVVMGILLGCSMLPQIAILSGLFEVIRALGLYDRLGSLVFADLFFALPFTIWLLSGFFRDLPRDLDDAARLDGCGLARRLFNIHLPLLWPGLIAAGLLTFMNCWNEFLFACTFTLSDSARTLPVGIGLISAPSRFELPFGTIMAASLLATIPPILLVLLFQNRIAAGLTAGAVK
ncbi:sugar ABC transporter permease [Novacetimonas maltaceti]|uniref:Trehalose transport system permease protein SugB n=1 Tax=Novacetimonas maltaceti TaxID=1203393 RepID=A0A2S3VYC6_9PROT|nr:carbohydrate ABC transporter permease [Novacetimonas maltaceti]POF61610.1 Trehalose transport system permease protein SugB [Novacetimonas maltaceti]PYD60089.1 sugar ABC transporter permease [Novacetimonas maltaceti]